MVEAQAGDAAGNIMDFDGQAFVFTQAGHQINRRIFPPVDFIVQQCRHRGAGIRHDRPFHPVKMDDFRSGAEARHAVAAWHIAGEFLEHHFGAGDAFICLEAERAAADGFRDRLHRIGLGEPFRHDRRGIGCKRIGQQAEARFQPDADHPVGRGADLGDACGKRSADRIARRKAIDAGDAITGHHLAAIMEKQPITQGQFPQQSIGTGGEAGQHLRVDVERVVDAKQGVENRQRIVAGDVGGGPHRIEGRQIGMRHEAQGTATH